jgi:lipoyl(octanoyl) transferase
MSTLIVRQLGHTAYEPVWQAMQAFTSTRNQDTPDELWVTEHDPVYTLGLNRKQVRYPQRTDIPVMLVDRGGKITYHGPGQAIIYLMVDLKRKSLSVRQLVSAMEHAVIHLLATHGVHAAAQPDAPGVYTEDGSKIASLGLRLKNQRSYHGLSLNIDMDTSPFLAIDPCGYQGLKVTQTRELGLRLSLADASEHLLLSLSQALGYTSVRYENTLPE